MALLPSDYTSQEYLQPGARGEVFQSDIPGHRNEGDRINRSNNHMNVSEHDVPNVKYEFDYRLPVLFRYGWAYGFNQIVIPKGRIVAADPNMDLVAFSSQKKYNTLTLANGGAPVRLRTAADKYPEFTEKTAALVSSASQGKKAANEGKEWAPVAGLDKTYKDVAYRPFAQVGTDGKSVDFVSAAKQLKDAGFEIDAEHGYVVDTATKTEQKNVRPGNIPLGMIERNEYTRDADAFNGIMPGPVLTDAMVEFPWFAYKDKAEENLWGSAYGGLFPGALVKPDENGRITISPLSFPDQVATMSISEYEAERQQVVGQIYAVNHELVPEGAAKWATWALEDRLKYEGFNPAVYAQNGRRGEDAVNSTPYASTGKYPGHPYDHNYLNHDLHMLASQGRADIYDPRMNPEYRLGDMGIPGLTDGYNAVAKEIPAYSVGKIHYAGDNAKEYAPMYFRTVDVDIEKNTLQISIDGAAFVPCTVGALLNDGAFKVDYASELQGIVVISVANKAKADALLKDKTAGADIQVKYSKRGEAGVPTFMDWDGCVGSVKVLLTK